MDDMDDLRENVAFLDEIEAEDSDDQELENIPLHSKKEAVKQKLTTAQKFIISILVFILISLFGFLIILISGKMVLPL